MLKKNRFARQVLSGLNHALSSSLSSDVEELAHFVENYKSVLEKAKEKTDKMIELIDADEFPADKKIQGDVFDLDSVVVPSTTAEMKNMIRETTKELNGMCSQIDQCYDHVMSKVQPEQVKIAPLRTPTKPSSVNTIDTNSSDHDFSPSSPLTPPQSRNEVKPVSSGKRGATPKAIVESVVKVPKRADKWDSSSEDPRKSFEGEIKEDSASNVRGPTNLNAFQAVGFAEDSEVQSLPPTVNDSSANIAVPQRHFSRGQEVSNITCEWIADQFHPYKFWLRVSDGEYDTLMTSLYHWKSQVRPLPEVKIKLYCLAKYNGDWYRAYVTRVLPDAAIVVFIDYGNMEYVEKTEMGVIPKEFTKLPWQAFRVALFGVKPGSSNPNCREAWPPQVLSVMKRWLADGTIDCRVVEAPLKLPSVILIRKTQNGKKLFLHEVILQQQKISSVNLAEQLDLLRHTPAPDTTEGADLPIESPRSPKQQLSDLVAPSPVSPDSNTGSSFHKAFNETHHCDGDPIDYCPPLPDSDFGVKLTAFHDGDDFYVQLADKPAAVDQKLTAKRCSKKTLDAVRVGRYILYFSPEREIYARGKVIGLANNGEEFDVLDVDTGLIDRGMPFPGTVAALRPPFLKDNRAAIHCCLDMHRTNPGTPLRLDFANFFKLKLAGRVLSASVSPKATPDEIATYRTGEKPLPVEIYMENEYLADLLYLAKPQLENGLEAWRKWKFDSDYVITDDEDDGDDEVLCPANPEQYLLGFEPRDDETLCKHFRRTGRCPRGKYCMLQHKKPVAYRSTVECEEFGVVGIMDPEVGTRIYVRLPSDWRLVLPRTLKERPDTSNVVPLWLQLPTGTKDWKCSEDELCRDEAHRDLTDFEDPYLEMEVDMTQAYQKKSFSTPNNLIPTEMTNVAVHVSPQDLCGQVDDSTTPFAWVRGAVIETLGTDKHARVQLVDYGCQIVAAAEHIRPLDNAFADHLPSLAMLFYVTRSSAEKLCCLFSQGESDEWGLLADVVGNDEQDTVPVIKLLSMRNKANGLEITLL